MQKFIDIENDLRLLNFLFIPPKDKNKIKSVLKELSNIQKAAKENSFNEFKKLYKAFREKRETLLKGIPRIGECDIA